jgi:hypothetical protein
MEKTKKIPTPPKYRKNLNTNNNNEININSDKIPSTTMEEEIKKTANKFNHNKKINVYKGKNFRSEKGKLKTIKQIDNLPIETKECSYCNKQIESVIFHMHVDSHPSKILDWLYLGSYNNATNKKELEYANIKYVLNCAQECKNLFESDFKYKHMILSVYKIYNKILGHSRLSNNKLF